MPWLYKAFKVKRENLGRGREAVAIVHHIHFASLGTNLIGIKQGQGQYNSVQSLSRVWLFVTPWTAAHQATRSITRVYSNSCPLSRWWHPTISSSVISFSSCLQSVPASGSFPMSQLFASGGQGIGVLTSDQSFNEYSGLISFRKDWLDLLAVQGILKSLLQHHSSKASMLWCSAFFMVQLSHPYMTTGKTIALTRQTFVGKVMSLLLTCCLGLSWLVSLGASIF